MAIEFISAQHFEPGKGDSGSFSITVPNDCDFVVLGAVWWASGTNHGFTYARINSVDMTIDKEMATAAGYEWTTILHLANPSTGSQTFSYDWDATPGDEPILVFGYFKGCDDADPIRDADGLNSIDNGNNFSANLTTVAGDFVVGFGGCYTPDTIDATPVGAGQTDIDTFDGDDCYSSMGYEEASGVSTNFAFTSASTSSACIISIKPAAEESASASAAGSSGATAVGKVLWSAKGAISSTATVVAIACVLHTGIGSVASTSGATAKAYREFSANASVSSTTTATAKAYCLYAGAGSAGGVSSATASGTVTAPSYVTGAGSAGGTSAATASACCLYAGVGSIGGISAVTAAGTVTAPSYVTGAGTVGGSTAATAKGGFNYSGVGSVSGSSSVTAKGGFNFSGVGSIAGTSSASARASVTWSAKGTVSSASSVTGAAFVYGPSYMWVKVAGEWRGIGGTTGGTFPPSDNDVDGGTW